MQNYTIIRKPRRNSQKPPLAFKGALLGDATGEDFATASTGRGGEGKRWTDIALYRTENGRYVAHTIGRSTIPGEKDIEDAEAFDTLADALNWFYPGRIRAMLESRIGYIEQA